MTAIKFNDKDTLYYAMAPYLEAPNVDKCAYVMLALDNHGELIQTAFFTGAFTQG